VTVYTPRSITEWPHLRRDNQAREEIAKLEARVRELEEALRFYADERHYALKRSVNGFAVVPYDDGQRARMALGRD
jgi:hypothetical protein